jgi:arylsulfatase
VVEPGTISNDIYSHTDLLPTFLAAVGNPDIKEQLLDGVTIGDMTYRVHLDGYNLLPYWSGEVTEAPRREFLYWNDDGDLSALRYDQWKLIFLEQRAEGWKVWSEPYVPLRKPLLENLLTDPFEKMHDVEVGANYEDWEFRRIYLLVPAQAYVAEWVQGFAEFPPRQEAASFSVDAVLASLEESGDG